MRFACFCLTLAAMAPISIAAPVQVSELAKPPQDATQFTIMSTAGVHGHSARWVAPDGSHMGRESLLLRGQAFETDSNARLGKDGLIEHLTVRGFNPSGDEAETFDIKDGVARWKSPVDQGSVEIHQAAMYSSFGGPVDLMADLVEALVATPTHKLTLLPGGVATAERLTSLVVGKGPAALSLNAYAIRGLDFGPIPVWVDGQGKFFAFDGGLTWIRAGYEPFQLQLDKAQDDAIAKRSPAIARSLLKMAQGPVAFTHVRNFVDGTRFVEDETVVVDHGVITTLGRPTPPPCRQMPR